MNTSLFSWFYYEILENKLSTFFIPHQDKKLWKVPDRIKDKAAFEENINRSIRQYNPDYWRARQSGIEAAKEARRPRPDREAAR